MKKQLLNLSFVAVGLALYICSAFATPTAPVRELEVPYGWPTPTMDGIAEDCYSAEQTTSLMYDAQVENWTGAGDFTAVFRIAYDENFLYVIATITDDIEESWTWTGTGTSTWTFDNLELFLQLDTNTTYTAYDTITEQFRICRSLDSVESDGTGARSEWGYYMEGNTGTGWLSECAVPWTSAANDGLLPEDWTTAAGKIIGFDFAGADSDNTDADPAVGNRDYQTGWDEDEPDGQEDQAWQNVTVFGYITLGIKPDAVLTNSASNINAFPNPTNNYITFDITGMQNVDIYSITGTKVMSQLTNGRVDISSLRSGIYVARIGNDSVRFVKE